MPLAARPVSGNRRTPVLQAPEECRGACAPQTGRLDRGGRADWCAVGATGRATDSPERGRRRVPWPQGACHGHRSSRVASARTDADRGCREPALWTHQRENRGRQRHRRSERAGAGPAGSIATPSRPSKRPQTRSRCRGAPPRGAPLARMARLGRREDHSHERPNAFSRPASVAGKTGDRRPRRRGPGRSFGSGGPDGRALILLSLVRKRAVGSPMDARRYRMLARFTVPAIATAREVESPVGGADHGPAAGRTAVVRFPPIAGNRPATSRHCRTSATAREIRPSRRCDDPVEPNIRDREGDTLGRSWARSLFRQRPRLPTTTAASLGTASAERRSSRRLGEEECECPVPCIAWPCGASPRVPSVRSQLTGTVAVFGSIGAPCTAARWRAWRKARATIVSVGLA